MVPNEVVEKIMSFLSIKELNRMHCVCRLSFRQLKLLNGVWKYQYEWQHERAGMKMEQYMENVQVDWEFKMDTSSPYNTIFTKRGMVDWKQEFFWYRRKWMNVVVRDFRKEELCLIAIHGKVFNSTFSCIRLL